jgi:heterodisulfide reductase subunit A
MMEKKSVLIIGGGVAGIQASLDLADCGLQVYLVEESPSIGGRMAQLDKTFPTMDCSICILAPKMVECFRHPNIKILVYSEVKEVRGSAGNFAVKIIRKPKYVDESKCNACGKCAEVCPVEVPNEFNAELDWRKAIYMPFPQAVPSVYVVDEKSCLGLSPLICGRCIDACEPEAIIPNQEPEEIELKVGAIIVATGFDVFNPSSMKEYGYGVYENVITALEFERLICASGPLGGHLERLSDRKEPHRIAFIQCVGSRSLKSGHPFCSAVCCMFATKEAILIKEHHPKAEVYIFYNELRAFGKGFKEFVDRARNEWGVKYIRSRPSEISENPITKNLKIRYEDTYERKPKFLEVDLVVLCPALVPRPKNRELAEVLGVETDEHGFFKVQDPLLAPVDTGVEGIFVCGYSQSPKDIPDSVAQASGAAARASEIIALTSR